MLAVGAQGGGGKLYEKALGCPAERWAAPASAPVLVGPRACGGSGFGHGEGPRGSALSSVCVCVYVSLRRHVRRAVGLTAAARVGGPPPSRPVCWIRSEWCLPPGKMGCGFATPARWAEAAAHWPDGAPCHSGWRMKCPPRCSVTARVLCWNHGHPSADSLHVPGSSPVLLSLWTAAAPGPRPRRPRPCLSAPGVPLGV